MKPTQERPPRDGLFRARSEHPELRAESNGGRPVIYGHFARFDEWTEINSSWEGNFMERIAPGAFKKTFSENRDAIKLLFQHGHDPQIGDKPLGVFQRLEEDEEGAYYEAELLDTAYVDDLIPGLRAGAYGASFRFTSVSEDFDQEPEPSDHNPKGLPERTIREVRCYEGGPVTFPAYDGATAGVRSLTDEVVIARAARSHDHFRELVGFFDRSQDLSSEEPETAGPSKDTPSAPDDAGAQDTSPHVDEGRESLSNRESEPFEWVDLLPKKNWEF